MACPRRRLLATLVLVLAVPSSASAAFKPITGRLDKPGFTVIAVAANGAASAVIAPAGSFSLVPPAGTVTLHLRAADGVYAGPVVLREQGADVQQASTAVAKAQKKVKQAKRTVTSAQHRLRKARGEPAKRDATKRLKQARAQLKKANRRLTRAKRLLKTAREWATLGAKAGASLGQIKINAAGGYALTGRLSQRAWKRWVDSARTAQAKNGVPTGAGNFGLVRSTLLNGAAIGDTDRDGIPNSLDVDDNGNLILDDYDRLVNARSSVVGGTFADGSHLQITTGLAAFAQEDSVNVNGGSSEAQIAAVEQRQGILDLFWTGIDPGSGEIDCGALVYCSRGGTGTFGVNSVPPAGSRSNVAPFPGCCDPDGDGLGSLISGGPVSTPPSPDVSAMGLYHGATADQIRAGDVLIERGTVNGTAQVSASSVSFVFSTFPVVASYNDGQGDFSTFTYPRAPGATSPVRAGANGNVVLRLALWRPQRPRIESEPGEGKWMDVGNLTYVVYAAPGGNQPDCPQSSFSEPGPNLIPLTSSPIPRIDQGAGGFADSSGDQPSSSSRTVNFTLNLTECLASRGLTIPSNGNIHLGVTAVATGRANNQFFTSSWTDFSVRP